MRSSILLRGLVPAFLLFLSACQKSEDDPVPTPAPPVASNGRDNNMALGNPSGAITSVVAANNHLIIHPQFTVGYDNSRGTARWVSWHLSMAWRGAAERCDCFEPDPLIPPGYFAAWTGHYTNTGFDRGHLCPSEDRDGSDADNATTFRMSNIIPQAPQMNQQTWADMEAFARDLAADDNELYIIAGGHGQGGTGSQGSNTAIAGGSITVPARCWKVMVVIPEGGNDLQRIANDGARVIAVDIPNTQSAVNLDWYDYRVSVDAIEASTGLDLFDLLPADVQEVLEEDADDGTVW